MASSRKVYPNRKPFYCVSLGRALFESGENVLLGDKATELILYVAFKEDQFHYRGWVNFWNSQLSQILGIKSRDKFIAARQKAIDAGWLLYDRQHDRTPGLYMTLNPTEVSRSGDTIGGANTDANGVTTGVTRGDVSGVTSIPLNPNNLKPNSPETGSQSGVVVPQLEDVLRYAAEWSDSDQAQGLAVRPVDCVSIFFDHYETYGWKSNSGPINCWKAAFRLWVQREKPKLNQREELRI